VAIDETIKALAARAGFHVVRNHNNPAHTFMGLHRYEFQTILDVGANIGQFGREIRERFPAADLICFEPIPRPFAELAEWAASQKGVRAVQLALGDAREQLSMFVHDDHTPSSSLLATTQETSELYPSTARQSEITVPVERLDDWIAANGVALGGNVLLKIDVQGFEMRVLKGAPETLARTAAVIIEANLEQLYEGQSRFIELVGLLDAAGLAYAGNLSQACAPDGRIVFVDAVFVRPLPATSH